MAEARKVHNHLVRSAASLESGLPRGSPSGSQRASPADSSANVGTGTHETNGGAAALGPAALGVAALEPEGHRKEKEKEKDRRSEVVLVLGWRRSIEMVMLITSLDDRLPKGYVSGTPVAQG